MLLLQIEQKGGLIAKGSRKKEGMQTEFQCDDGSRIDFNFSPSQVSTLLTQYPPISQNSSVPSAFCFPVHPPANTHPSREELSPSDPSKTVEKWVLSA